MNNIRNYEELLEEQCRIESRIATRKIAIGEELREIKEKLEPFLYLLPILTILKDVRTNKNNTVIKILTSLGIDLVGQKLLSKTNWITRLVLPWIVKKVSRNTIDRIR